HEEDKLAERRKLVGERLRELRQLSLEPASMLERREELLAELRVVAPERTDEVGEKHEWILVAALKCEPGHAPPGSAEEVRGAPGDPPADRRQAARGANAEDRPGDRVRGRDRDAEASRDFDDCRGARLGGEAVDGLERRDAHSHRSDDPPAARRGPKTDRERADDLHPRVDDKGPGVPVERVDREG